MDAIWRWELCKGHWGIQMGKKEGEITLFPEKKKVCFLKFLIKYLIFLLVYFFLLEN